jgi:indolepyruvate ferredoxin oxidoreductase, beta subunit
MKQAETHGMSQRGGDVQSFMRISDRPIYSDLIAKGRADIILSVEPMEASYFRPKKPKYSSLATQPSMK